MNGRVIIGSILILIGLSAVFDFPFFNLLFAGFIIWLGIKIISGSSDQFRTSSETNDDQIKRVLIFSGIDQKVTSNNFTGGEIVAVFGGGDVDLSQVKTRSNKVELNFVTIFGGLKVKIPSSWSVNSEGMGILGGFNNRSKGEGKKVTVATIKGVAIFGGVEIVN